MADTVTKQKWIRTALKWMKKPAETKDEGDVKYFRKKTYKWLCTLDAILQKCTGHNLMHWSQPEHYQNRQHWSKWPYLSLAADQGSDGFAASWFMKNFLKLNCESVWDPNHGVWRDIELTWSSLKLGPFVRLMTIVMNMTHGPWESGERWHQLAESTDEYLKVMSCESCPLFAHYLEKMADDFGVYPETCGDRNMEVVVWERCEQHWSRFRRGTKVALCRWGNFSEAARDFDSGFHWMLVRILFLGLMVGLFGRVGVRLA